MSESSIRSALKTLLGTQTHSYASYMLFAEPWDPSEAGDALANLRLLVGEQRRLAQRISDFTLAQFGSVEASAYPMAYTGLHDCSFDYLLGQTAASQDRDIRTIEKCVRELAPEKAAHKLAEEALGAAKGHLETIREWIATRKQTAATS